MTLRVNKLKNLGICGRPYYFCVDNYMENLVLLNIGCRCSEKWARGPIL